MLYYDARGRAAPDGDYEFRNGQLVIRDGRRVIFSHLLFDKASTQESPSSIDEALKQRFSAMAERQGTTVAEMLARMPQAQIEETAAQVATEFVSGLAGSGIAARFADSGSSDDDVADAYLSMVEDMARASLPKRAVAAPESVGKPGDVADAYAAMVADLQRDSRPRETATL